MLHEKLDFMDQSASVKETAAYKDIAPELERLRIKALTRAREYLMGRSATITRSAPFEA